MPEMSEVISDGKDSRCQIYIIMSSFKGDVLKILFTFGKNDSIVIELATFGGPEGYRRLWLDSLQPLSGGGGAGRANKSQKWCNSQRIEADAWRMQIWNSYSYTHCEGSIFFRHRVAR